MSGKPTPDPGVTIVAWSGPLSALAARLGRTPAVLLPKVKRRCVQSRGGFLLEVHSPAALTAAARALDRPDEA